MIMFYLKLPSEVMSVRVSTSPFLSNLVTDRIKVISLSLRENGAIEIPSDRELSDLEHGHFVMNTQEG